MENPNATEDAELVHERLIRVENALFFLKMKSKCFARWDNSEIERLETLHEELRVRYEDSQMIGTVVG